jgi:putative flippase GtrA
MMRKMGKLNKTLDNSLIRYLTVGITAFGVDYAFLLMSFYLLKAPVVFATSVGFLAGLVVSFVANRYWVYGKSGSERPQHKQLVEYIVLLILNYIFTVFAVKFLLNNGVEPYIGKIIVMAFITCWNYILFSKFIFSSK